jgi:hypothetical protein
LTGLGFSATASATFPDSEFLVSAVFPDSEFLDSGDFSDSGFLDSPLFSGSEFLGSDECSGSDTDVVATNEGAFSDSEFLWVCGIELSLATVVPS